MPVAVFPVGPFRRVVAGTGLLDPCQKSLGSKSLTTLWGTGTKIRWFDASQEVYLDNTRQATIHDFSVNADNAVQAVVARQALFQVGSAPRGGPIFNFDAQIEGYLTALGAAAGSTTTHIVVRYLLGQAPSTEVFGWFAAAGGPAYMLDGGGPPATQGDVLGVIGTGPVTPAVCGWQVDTIVNNAGSNFQVYRNGVLLVTGGPGNNNAPTSFSIGSATPGTSLGAIMQLAELVHLSGALTAAQVATDVAGAKTKWGLPI